MIRTLGALSFLGALFLPFIAANYAEELPDVTPVTYCMFCDGREYPNNGPIGYYEFTTWDRINPAPGVFDWSDLDAKIAKCPNDAPLLLIVEIYLSWPVRSFVPAWIPNGNLWLDAGPCASVPIPNYTNGAMRDAYWAMIEAFGQRYDSDARVSIVIDPGLDGEAVLAKPEGGCDWLGAARQIPGLENEWGKWVKQSIVRYREAFPHRPVFFPIAAGGQARCVWADICAMQNPPVGLKHNGMTADLPDATVQGDPPCCGAFTAFEQHPELPRIVESKSGAGNIQSLVWSMYMGMSLLPDAVVVHPDYLTRMPPGMMEQFSTTYGKDTAASPMAWAVFRDREYPLVSWCATSGYVGDWQSGLRRVEGGYLLQGDAVPVLARTDWRGRQARRGPMTLMLDPAFDVSRGCALIVDWFDLLTEPWAITWWDGAKRREAVFQGTGAQIWRTSTIEGMTIDPSEYIGIEGEMLVHETAVWSLDADLGAPLHRVQIWSWAHLLGTPTATPTWTATIEKTASPSSTCTPTIEETVTSTTTPTPEPLPTPTWTIDEEIYQFRRDLEGRLFHDLGGFWVVDVTMRPATSTYPTLAP